MPQVPYIQRFRSATVACVTFVVIAELDFTLEIHFVLLITFDVFIPNVAAHLQNIDDHLPPHLIAFFLNCNSASNSPNPDCAWGGQLR